MWGQPLSIPRLGETRWSRLVVTASNERTHSDRLEGNVEGTISTKELKAKLDRKDGLKLVETLAPERYREAHLPGALNIPPEKIKELAPQLLPNKDAEIITYCANSH